MFFQLEGDPVHLTSSPEERFREAALVCLDGLYGFALALSRDASMADDLVQETYARAQPGGGLVKGQALPHQLDDAPLFR